MDAQNAPALKLYYRPGLRQVATKLGLMRHLSDRPAFVPFEPVGR